MCNFNYFSTSITDRGWNALTLPFTIGEYCLEDSVKTVIGVAGTALSVLTFGMIPAINDLANQTRCSRHLSSSLICVPFREVINPNARGFRFYPNTNPGYFTIRIARPIFDAACNSAESKNKFSKHVVSRSAYMAGALVATATRTMDFALGIFAFALSIITLGTHSKINDFALKNLAVSSIINDVCIGVRGFVNPQQYFQM